MFNEYHFLEPRGQFQPNLTISILWKGFLILLKKEKNEQVPFKGELKYVSVIKNTSFPESLPISTKLGT